MYAEKKNAYLTVYLSLIMAVMLSLCLALIEGVRSNAVYLEAECVADIGMNSILAEYHRELLKQYNLFAIDSSYGTACPGVLNTRQHLADYIEKNFSGEDVVLDWLIYKDFLGLSLKDIEMTGVSILTDDDGELFRRRAAEAVKDDVGLNLYQELKDWMQEVQVNELTERDVAKEKAELDAELAAYDGTRAISEKGWVIVKVENPTDFLEGKRKEGILKQVTENPDELSDKTICTDNLISARKAAGVLNRGNGNIPEIFGDEKLLERFFFQEYLLRYMGNYRNSSEDDALQYQVEYLIAGKENDLDNLRSVANTLCAMREAANLIYLYSDQEKCAVAKAAAAVLAFLMAIPEAEELIETILLFGWAYAESIHDLKSIFAGGRVPLLKDSASWYYDLDTALGLGKAEKSGAQNVGLAYEDYLRILMMLKETDVLTFRAIDMVEADIRQTPGNEAFRMDGCFDSVEARIEVASAYGYSCEITRQKGYATQ